MTLGVNTLINAITPILIGRFAMDFCSGADGALVVSVYVVHEDVESRAHSAAERSRTLPRFDLGREPQHDEAVLQLYLPMYDCAILVGHPEAYFKAKSFDQPVNGGGNVVIKKMRSDSGHVLRGI
jgi:hypothetical protein